MTLPLRKGSGIMLLNKAGQVFIAKRIDFISLAWQMPQGGIDEGESPQAAALRELEEETSIKSVELIARAKEWHTYRFPPELVSKLWGGQYSGQQQMWFLMRFLGEDDEINLQTAHPEFNDWKWTSVDDLLEVVIDFKRDLYRAVIEEFKGFI